MRGNKIPEQKKLILMGLCGGKCEFRGCNKSVLQDMLTEDKSNFSNYAHIIAASENGPRGDKYSSNRLSDDENNIMVLCRDHHKDIDDFPEKYTVDLLKDMKKEHEDYIRDLMNIKKESTVAGIKYTFNISDRVPKINDDDARRCAFKQKYFCIGDIINLSDSKCDEKNDSKFYEFEKENIEKNFLQLVKPQFKKENVKKIFLYAIAPQPLLIYLGTLFSDISNVEVQQLQREPVQEWFLDDKDNKSFKVNIIKPKKKNVKVALNISITADIAEERIKSVMGEQCDIIKIESNIHGNDIIKNKSQLEEYRNKIRETFEYIKDIYGRDCEINIFPAMPISIAVETGRCWMKKTHPNLIIYDEKKGFKKALEIKYEGER
jgi:hypothetical protein